MMEVEIHVNEHFAKEFYDNCKDTKMTATGASVMTAFGASQSASDFMNFLGWTSGLSPNLGGTGMHIVPTFVSTTMHNVTGTIPSNSPVGLDGELQACSQKCSCGDCPSNCPAVDIPAPPKTIYVTLGRLRVSLLVFLTSLIGVIIGLGIIVLAVVLVKTKPNFAPEERLALLSPSINGKRRSGSSNGPAGHHAQVGVMAILAKFYRIHGRFVARHPIIVLLASLAFTAFCGAWIYRLHIITRPESLWVPPGSLTASDKQYSDNQFGPFYRIEQAIIRQKGDKANTPILTQANLLSVYNAFAHLRWMNVTYSPKKGPSVTFSLDDICFKPMIGKSCLVTSPLAWFQNNRSHIENPNAVGVPVTVSEYLSACFEYLKFDDGCMTEIGTPVDAPVVLGGFSGKDYINADTMVMTFLVANHVDENQNDLAKAWETEFINFWKSEPLAENFTVAFSAQRSVEDELARESAADIPTVIISYSAMFLYVAISLGSLKRPLWVHSKVLLALGGIMVVIFSILISVGLCSLFGVAATLIISEVIPFLVLAIGVDNIFILVDTYQATDPKQSVEFRLGETLALVGSSITMASLSESAAFLLGMLTRMPAVVAFSVYASVAILFDFLLQITFFAALVALDGAREEAGRWDVLPCFKTQLNDSNLDFMDTPDVDSEADIDPASLPAPKEFSDKLNGHGNENGQSYAKFHNGNGHTSQGSSPTSQSESSESEGDNQPVVVNGYVAKFFDRYYAPFLFHPITKTVVLLAFVAMLLAGINLAPRVQLGLAQQVALPQDSYLIDYFDELATYGRAGPPVYFIVKNGFNYTDVKSQDLLCSIDAEPGGCRVDSLDNRFYMATQVPGTSFVQDTTLSSWLDTYLIWLKPATGCCNEMANGTFCPVVLGQAFPPECKPCLTTSDFNSIGRPNATIFMKYFRTWLGTTCNPQCGSCGSVFAMDIKLDESKSPMSSEYIYSTRFRSFHRNLATQADFISGLRGGYNLADKATKDLGIDIIPYSVFYIFFEQYLYIERVAAICIGLALAAVFVVTLVLLGNVLASFMIILIVFMIEIDLLGVMAIWSINLNAVSVVNLVMAIGISVEFCVHLFHSYINHTGTPQHRARVALVEMGSSVLKGITLTKFAGVLVLAFAHSEIFKVYYFRMFFTIVILGCLHGLVLLPTILSMFGPSPRKRACALW
jgi:Niemann-Pick C1 protein